MDLLGVRATSGDCLDQDDFFPAGQTLIIPSNPPLAMNWLFGENANVVTVPRWALIVASSLPAGSQILIV